MSAIILPHPEKENVELRVVFRTKNPPEWSGLDEEERADLLEADDFEPEITLTAIYERSAGGEWEDRSDRWAFSRWLDEVEEEATTVYIQTMRERYVDNLARR